MAGANGVVKLQHACRRGALVGVVLAGHLALLVWLLLPAKPQRSPRSWRSARTPNVLRVELLVPPTRPPAPRQATVVRVGAVHRHTPLRAASNHDMQATLVPTPTPTPTPTPVTSSAISSAPAAPAYVAGGGLSVRLQQAAQSPNAPALPGGKHYLAEDLVFVPVEQQSIAGKVHKVAALFFGGFDPVCKNTEYELTKSRAQQLADGYTQHDLQQRLREHHCS